MANESEVRERLSDLPRSSHHLTVSTILSLTRDANHFYKWAIQETQTGQRIRHGVYCDSTCQKALEVAVRRMDPVKYDGAIDVSDAIVKYHTER